MGMDLDLDSNDLQCGNENPVDCEEDVDHGNEIGNRDTFECNDNIDKGPEIGMEFDSLQSAYSFYKNYAKNIGFAVATKASRRSKISRQFIDVKYACTRHGTKRESNAVNPRPCLKMDCKATLHIKRKQDGKWFVQNFIKDHNHELFPADSHFFPHHRRINSAKRHDISTLDDVGVKAIRSYVAVAKQHGGYENIGCLEKDFRNQLDKECRLALESGDANAMLEFFVHMQEENPNFFYALDLDEEHRLKNIFWVDAKGREDYREFGDVVSLDTTYITNKYKMPFTPFIGVNNHHQATLLGCALLANESTSTFTWLMKTWVRAMGGKLPSAIITDQDKAMKAAIKLVFPNSRHHYCLWHILRKIPEKLDYVLRKNEDFMGIFKKCIHKSWIKDQFEERWQAMVEKFDLIEDEWIQSLYEDREHWVPTYMKDTFFAGMSTTQRSESINSFLDKYVCRKTTLKEFLEKYEVALQDRQEAENLADFTTWHKTPALRTPSPFEKQMSMVYTHGVFKKFQIEVLGIFGCHLVKEKEDEKILTFKVLEIEKNEGFIVEWDASMEEISCICRSFEYNGFLCRHSLSTLHFLGLFNIPSRYIVKRWTKDVRTKYKKGSTCEEVQSKKQRRDILFQRAIELIEEGSMSHESYNIAHQVLGDALKHCSSVNHSLKLSDEAAFGANEYHDL